MAATPDDLSDTQWKRALDLAERALLSDPDRRDQLVDDEAADPGVTEDGDPYLVMELVRGGDSIVEHACRHQHDPATRMRLALALCRAVQHGHDHGIIHRDIKPSNVLVDDEGIVKVIDFGVARATDLDIGATLATAPGAIVGTLPYLAPERVERPADAADARADVYAIGLVLFELFAESPARGLTGLSVAEALDRIRRRRTFSRSTR